MPLLLNREFCTALTLAFGHFLWQGLLIALVAAVVSRQIKSASLKYSWLVSSLLVMLGCTVATLSWTWSGEVGRVRAAQTSDFKSHISENREGTRNHDGTVSHNLNSDNGELRSGVAGSEGTNVTDSVERQVDRQFRTGQPPDGDDTFARGSVQVPSHNDSLKEIAGGIAAQRWQFIAPWLTSAYFVGVFFMLLRLLAGLWGGWRLRHSAVPVTEMRLVEALSRQSQTLRLRFQPVLAYCDRVAVPTVIGILKPTILLPLAITSGLSPEQVESVLAHELAHLKRYDHFVNLVQRVIESLLFFHPAVWWVSRRIRIEREHCCDDLVVACGAVPLDYATSLLRVAELSRRQRTAPSFAAVSLLATDGKPSTLRHRIARLLGESIDTPVRLRNRWPVALSALAIFLMAIGVSRSWTTSRNEQQLKASPYKVELPDGSTVELLGVSRQWDQADANSFNQLVWWLPNGEPSATPLEELSNGITFVNDESYKHWPTVAVRIRNAPTATGTLRRWVVIEGARYSTAVARVMDPDFYEQFRSAGPLPGIKSGVVRVAVGSGDFGPWQTIKINGQQSADGSAAASTSTELDGDIPDELRSSYQLGAEVKFAEVNGQTRLITGPLDVSKMRAIMESELIDLDGQIIRSDRFHAVNGEWGKTYPIPLSRVSHYRFRLQPYRHWVTFENVSFQADHRTEVKSSIGPTPEMRRDPRIAELPNGVKVEFVGLARMEAEPKEWWKPDGSLLDEIPTPADWTISKTTFYSQARTEFRRVLVRVHGKLSYLNASLSGMSSTRENATHGSENPFVQIKGGYALQAGQNTASMEIGIATRPLSPVRMIDASGRKLPREADASPDHIAEDIEVLRVGEPRFPEPKRNGQAIPLTPAEIAEREAGRHQTEITYVPVDRFRPVDFQMTLIDVDGIQHFFKQQQSHIGLEILRIGSRNIGETQSASLIFDVPISRVARFEYRLRPFDHWVTFENVALNPGEMTDVKVRVASNKTFSETNSPLRLLNADGTPSTETVVSASVGYPGEKSKDWFAYPTKEGIVSLEKLWPGTHWLVAASGRESRTVFPVTLPTKHAVLEQRLREARSFASDDIAVASSVRKVGNGDAIIGISITNDTDEAIIISQEDVTLTMLEQSYRIFLPQIAKPGQATAVMPIKIEPNQQGYMAINWTDIVLEGLWAPRLEAIHEPWLAESQPDKVQVRVHLCNQGTIPLYVTDPKTIVAAHHARGGKRRESSEEVIVRKFDQPTSVTFDNTSFKDALSAVATQHDIPILLDEKALSDLEIKDDTPVVLKATDVKLRDVLEQILKQVGEGQLGFVIEDEVLKITTSQSGDDQSNATKPSASEAVVGDPNLSKNPSK